MHQSARSKSIGEDDGALWRRLLMAEEDRLLRFPRTVRPGGYRWFRSVNVVAIEHFRKPHTSGQKAGRFGWL